MPRAKKPPGQAVDRRNGARVQLAAAGKAVRPRRPTGLCPEAVRQWDEFWKSPVSRAITPADRGVVLRWIDAVDRYLRLVAEADLAPTVKGSQGQDVVNPLYKIAEQALGTVERAEKQIGIGSLNRSSLGVTVIQEQRSLAAMNAQRYGGEDEDAGYDDDAEEADPRLGVVEGEVV